MEISVAKLPKSKVEITVIVSPEEFEAFRKSVLADFSSRAKVEGFRQGKAPSEVVQREIGEEALLAETARTALSEGYAKAIDQEKLDVLGEPQVTVKKLAPGNPFEFQIIVAILPGIDLPEYAKIAKEAERKEVMIEDKEIENALQWLRESRKEEDGPIPELTDGLAQSLGNFKGVEDLRVSIKEGLLQEKRAQESQRLQQEVLGKIAEKAKAEIPDVLIEQEKRAMLENTKQGVKQMMQIEFAQYLEQVKKTEAEVLESFCKEAEKRVKVSLVLREITRQEHIEATPEDVEEEVNKVLAKYANLDTAKEQVDLGRLTQYVKGVIENEKTLKRLEELIGQ
ncbi:MAG: hypothetical protein HYV77_04085 [Candidatus Wildermuthbacteria bacterium]|nr:hypothetical protein [Candidatus Wildermuthbacteria bacterium]